ncbi:MAG: Smr/MutS family protein [Bdellovibrionales bacterium]
MMSDEDDELWDKMMEDVTPLPERIVSSPRKTKKTSPKTLRPPSPSQPSEREAPPPKKGKEIDRRTEQKFVQGKMVIEGRLDLHGMDQSQAHAHLLSFILNSYKQKKRCVLIVTGKGKGILQRQVPLWLEEATFDNIILRVVQARPKDGGSGALYIYLRKQRG